MSKLSWEYALIPLPMLLGFLTSRLCPPTKNAGESVSWRPAPVIFGIAWTILYLLMGTAWFLSYKRNPNDHLVSLWMVFVLILTNMWLYMYSSKCNNNKKWALWVLLLSLLASVLVYTWMNKCRECQMMMAPLCVWLIFAIFLSVTEL